MRAASPLGIAFVFAALGATSVRAADAAEADVVRARVHVDAPVSCADDASFWHATSRRTDRLRRVDDGADVVLDVVVRPSDRGASGDVRITRSGRTFAQRKLSGASCDEVTQALSLVVALAFDPAARVDVAAEETREESAPPPEPPLVIASPIASPAPAAERRTDDRAAHPRWRFSVAGHASAMGVAAPGATLGYGGFVDLERDASGLSPSFRASVVRTEGAASSVAGGVGAEIVWTIARASICPVRADLAPSLTLRPCLGADAGTMAARATGLERVRDRTRPWVAASAAARLAWSPVRAAFVEAEGGAAVPFVRDELAVDPSVSLYRAPSVALSAQFAAGVRFP